MLNVVKLNNKACPQAISVCQLNIGYLCRDMLLADC